MKTELPQKYSMCVRASAEKKNLGDNSETGGFLIEAVRIFECCKNNRHGGRGKQNSTEFCLQNSALKLYMDVRF